MTDRLSLSGEPAMSLFDQACTIVLTEERNLQPVHCRECGKPVFARTGWQGEAVWDLIDGLCFTCAWADGADEPVDREGWHEWLRNEIEKEGQ